MSFVKVSIGLTPLIGVQVKLDLFQAYATTYASADILDVIRQQQAEHEKLVKQGNQGAYAGLALNLIVKGELYFNLAFESNAEKKLNWRVEGSLSATGTAKAKEIIAFDITPQNRVEMK